LQLSFVTVRNLSDETHRALKVRAAEHNCSIEEEIRSILENAVRPKDRIKLGSILAEIGREVGFVGNYIATGIMVNGKFG
jgi:plasmid stability protein